MNQPPRSRAQLRQRREECLRLMERALVEGMPLEDACRAAALRFALSPQVAADYARRLVARLEHQGQQLTRGRQRGMTLAVSVRRRTRLYQEALQQGDVRLALEAEKDLCRLLGMYAAERNGEEPPSDDELDRTIEHELARLAAAAPAETAAPAAAAQRLDDEACHAA